MRYDGARLADFSVSGDTKRRQSFDGAFFTLSMLLLLIGVIMVLSSSYARAYYDPGNVTGGNAAYYFVRQLIFALLGIGCMLLASKLPMGFYRSYALHFLLLTLVLLMLVPVIGVKANGSRRWLGIGGLTLQPSELAKLAVIIFLAMLIERIPKKLGNFSSIIKVMVIMFPLLAVIAYSNLSTAVIVFGIAVCMLFVASPKYKQFVVVGVAGVSFVVAFIMLASYRSGRVQAWLHPETAGDDGYQTLQGLYAIGSGKLFGKGLGESLQKMGNVPESQNDMIFTIICEELGLFGAICVILLYVLLLWRMMVIANNAKDLYGALLVTGIMSHIAIQVILNIAVVTNTIPNTGVILPFISYGGTSLVFLMAEMGLALSVSKGIRLESIE